MTIYTDNALRPVAGFFYIPDSMEARGDPKPLPPFPGVSNGLGEEVRAGNFGFDWYFPSLTRTEMNWWKTLIGWVSGDPASNISKRFVYSSGLPAARLWDITGDMVNYKVAVIYMPTWNNYKNGYFRDCTVKFRRLEEFDA